MTRRWIIEKDHRRCQNYSCDNYDNPKLTRSAVNAESGKITTACKACDQYSEYQANSFKDQRPCKRCKHVRDVTVRLWPKNSGGTEEHFHETCDACDLEASASSHASQAQKFFEKARRIRAARKTK